MVVH
jgi:hypothetical protein